MSLDWTEVELAEGLRCYRAGEFFLAHEHWESTWLKSEQPDKTFLQALIQITAAFHHLQRKNTAGTSSLLRGALRKLKSFPDNYSSIDVASLRESIRTWLQALESEDQSPHLPYPRMR